MADITSSKAHRGLMYLPVLMTAIFFGYMNFSAAFSADGICWTSKGIFCRFAYGWPDKAVFTDGSWALRTIVTTDLSRKYNSPEFDYWAAAWDAYLAASILALMKIGCDRIQGRQSAGLKLQMHLSTAVLIYLFASGMLALNLILNGWPRCLVYGSCCRTFYEWNAVVDGLVAIQILTVVWYICERRIRRHKNPTENAVSSISHSYPSGAKKSIVR